LGEYLFELNFKDNQNVIDFLDKKDYGVYHLIDDSSGNKQSSDKALLDSIFKYHAKCDATIIPKMKKDFFTVIHTARAVDYCITGFRVKNVDEMALAVINAIEATEKPEVFKVFKYICKDEQVEEEKTEKKKSKTDKYLGAKFRKQMKELMDELLSCECHFIRCIKPNEDKKAKSWVGWLTIE